MDTLESSLEANCDRWTGRQNDKATYRGSSYHSSQKSQLGCGRWAPQPHLTPLLQQAEDIKTMIVGSAVPTIIVGKRVSTMIA